jgi:hypothetical protein
MLSLWCRIALWIAERLVPARLRAAWQEDWRGDFWEWTLKAVKANAPDSRSALIEHTHRAFKAALLAQFSSELGQENWRNRVGDPRFCLALGLIPLLMVTILSGGFSASRRLIRGLPYPHEEQIVNVAEGAPFLGIRLGFDERDVTLFRAQAKTIDGIATYQWYREKFGAGRAAKDIAVAQVSPDFFHVFGVAPMLGKDLSGQDPDTSDAFVASYDFWRYELAGDPALIGKNVWIAGRPMKLTGVMPKGFWFLVGDTAVWTARELSTAPPDGKWWMHLRGAVARVRPGIANSAVEKELRELQQRATVVVLNGHTYTVRAARRNWGIYVTGASTLVYQSIGFYGEVLLISLGSLMLWAALQGYLAARRNGRNAEAFRYWGFLVLKVTAPLVAVFFIVCEFTGANTLAMVARNWWERILFNDWAFFCTVVLLIFWALRDQRIRCRVCLDRMRQPVRIGIPGQILLDTAGVEVMCPTGHGAMYTSDSVLGSEMSNRWMGFEDVLK